MAAALVDAIECNESLEEILFVACTYDKDGQVRQYLELESFHQRSGYLHAKQCCFKLFHLLETTPMDQTTR